MIGDNFRPLDLLHGARYANFSANGAPNEPYKEGTGSAVLFGTYHHLYTDDTRFVGALRPCSIIRRARRFNAQRHFVRTSIFIINLIDNFFSCFTDYIGRLNYAFSRSVDGGRAVNKL